MALLVASWSSLRGFLSWPGQATSAAALRVLLSQCLSLLHTHTRTHTHLHMHTHAHTHTLHTHAHTYTHAFTHVHTCAHTRTLHTHVHTRAYMHTRIHTYTCTYIHTWKHINTHSHFLKAGEQGDKTEIPAPRPRPTPLTQAPGFYRVWLRPQATPSLSLRTCPVVSLKGFSVWLCLGAQYFFPGGSDGKASVCNTGDPDSMNLPPFFAQGICFSQPVNSYMGQGLMRTPHPAAYKLQPGCCRRVPNTPHRSSPPGSAPQTFSEPGRGDWGVRSSLSISI